MTVKRAIMRKPRKKRPAKHSKDYDSAFEEGLHNGVLKRWKRNTGSIPYYIEKKYYPDFIREVKGKKYLLEAKGRFWDHAEYSKYVHVAKFLPDDVELIFVFMNPDAPMPRAKKRKDGTKLSHGEWATKNGFRWFTKETMPKELK